MTVVAPAVLSPAPAAWTPDAHIASRKGEPLVAQELMSFGAPDPTEETPALKRPVETAVSAVPWSDPVDVPQLDEEPETGKNDFPLSAESGDDVEVTEQPTTVGPLPVRKPLAPGFERDTEVMAARPRRGAPIAAFDDDATKKRDRHVALMVALVGGALIAVVFLATRYEPPAAQYGSHGPLKQTGFEDNMNTGGARGKGGGGGPNGKELKDKEKAAKKRARSQYAPTAAQLASADTCVDRCAKRQMQCLPGCGKSESCRERCLDSAASCENGCDDAVEASAGDCITETGAARPCGPTDRERQKQALDQVCRDGDGEIVACPDQVAKLQDAENYLKSCGDQCAPEIDGQRTTY